jgi:hypothetical protein
VMADFSANCEIGDQTRGRENMIRKKPARHLDSGAETGLPRKTCSNKEVRS